MPHLAEPLSSLIFLIMKSRCPLHLLPHPERQQQRHFSITRVLSTLQQSLSRLPYEKIDNYHYLIPTPPSIAKMSSSSSSHCHQTIHDLERSPKASTNRYSVKRGSSHTIAHRCPSRDSNSPQYTVPASEVNQRQRATQERRRRKEESGR